MATPTGALLAGLFSSLFGTKILKDSEFVKIMLHSNQLPDLIGNVGSEESGTGYTREGDVMKKDIELFTIYQAANGFYAKMMASGRTVVGATLSEVCSFAQAAAAEERIEDENNDPDDATSAWKKVR